MEIPGPQVVFSINDTNVVYTGRIWANLVYYTQFPDFPAK